MSKFLSVTLVASAMAAAGIAGPASADVFICSSLTDCTYNLDNFVGSGAPPPGPYGSIQIVQNGANVDVSVVLNPGDVFAVTGSGKDFLWDFHNDPTITVQLLGTSVGEFAFLTNYSKPKVGAWDYGFECIACGNGTSPPQISALTFEIRNATLSEFVQNASGFEFASDLGIDCTGGQGRCYTGPVVGSLGNRIPEPMTLSLFGVGLLGAGAIRRRKRGPVFKQISSG